MLIASSAQVKKLAKRVGYRCSNPNCRELTSGPSLSILKPTTWDLRHILQQRHLVLPASIGSARYSCPDENRRSATVAEGMLHDSVEDNLTTVSNIDHVLGKEIGGLVDGSQG